MPSRGIQMLGLAYKFLTRAVEWPLAHGIANAPLPPARQKRFLRDLDKKRRITTLARYGQKLAAAGGGGGGGSGGPPPRPPLGGASGLPAETPKADSSNDSLDDPGPSPSRGREQPRGPIRAVGGRIQDLSRTAPQPSPEYLSPGERSSSEEVDEPPSKGEGKQRVIPDSQGSPEDSWSEIADLPPLGDNYDNYDSRPEVQVPEFKWPDSQEEDEIEDDQCSNDGNMIIPETQGASDYIETREKRRGGAQAQPRNTKKPKTGDRQHPASSPAGRGKPGRGGGGKKIYLNLLS